MFKSLLRFRFLKIFKKPLHCKQNFALIRPPQLYAVGQSCFSKYFCFAVMNFVAFAEPISTHQEHEKKSVEAQIKQSDELFSVGKFEESIKILEPYEDSENIEVLWRVSRGLYNLSKAKGISKSDNASLIKDSYQYIEKALQLNQQHYAVHKWMAIVFDAKSALEGMKARINALPLFKEHLMKAIELNPKDATSIYMLGQYMYNIADMSWLQRTIAKSLFGTPPEASFEEAFHYFSKAEEAEPNFYSANLLMLGKTCLKLKRIEAGHYWLKCALAYPVRTDEDEAVRLEAEELLKNYPVIKLSEKNENVN